MTALPRIAINTKIAGFLHRLHWLIMDVPEGRYDLLLSDDPLARTNGLATPQGHLAMPLSPRRMLIGAYDAEFARHLRVANPRDLLKGMNDWTVQSARHFVCARDRGSELYIRKHFGTQPKRPLLGE